MASRSVTCGEGVAGGGEREGGEKCERVARRGGFSGAGRRPTGEGTREGTNHVEDLAQLGALVELARESAVELVAHEAQQVRREGQAHVREGVGEGDAREDDPGVADEVGHVRVHVIVPLEEARGGTRGRARASGLGWHVARRRGEGVRRARRVSSNESMRESCPTTEARRTNLVSATLPRI